MKRALAVSALALLAVLAFAVPRIVPQPRPPADGGASAEARLARIRDALDERLREALAVADCARDRGPRRASAECLSPSWRGRLEGVALSGRDGEYLEWDGTPWEVESTSEDPTSRWTPRARGLRRGLVVRSAPGPDGRFGVATFALDAPPFPDPEVFLLPARIVDGAHGSLRFRTGLSPQPEADRDASPFVVEAPVSDPAGRPFAVLRLEMPSAAATSAAARALGTAWAGVLAAAAALLLPRWRVVGASLRHAATALLALAAARAGLAAARSLEVLLPREWGGPGVFGLSGFLGWLASPAALLATTSVGLAAAFVLRTLALSSDRRRRLPGVVLATGAAAVSVAGLVALAFSLARNGQPGILPVGGVPGNAGLLILFIALGAAALATAVVLSAAVRGSISARAGSAGRLVEGLAVVIAAALGGVAYLHAIDRDAVERLRAEFAPLVLEQDARRRLALRVHVEEAARSPRVAAILAGSARGPDITAGWEVWSTGPLALRGWLSSLDVFDAAGTLRAQFSFGLPPLRDVVPPTTSPESAPEVRTETFPFGAAEQRLLHAASPVVVSGRTVGTIVAHVLDEPDNLPFLPWVAPYLVALGTPGAARGDGPDYVLYASDGRVLVSTLSRAPGAAAFAGEGDAAGAPRVVRSGESRFLGLAIRQGDRLHALLLPARTGMERIGAVVRLVLLELAVLAILAVLRALARRRGPAALLEGLRASFYRKLLASMLLASLLPLLGLALFLRASVARGSERSLEEAAAGVVGVARRVVEDYSAVLWDDPDEAAPRVDDGILAWLRRLVGQEIHVFEDGRLTATSKPELYDSGLLAPRLPGEIQRAVVLGGDPYRVREERLGRTSLPVAYARADLDGSPAVVAVPLVLQRREATLALDRIREILLLSTVLLGALLAVASAWIARTVARPVGDLVEAAGRISRGDYGARIESSSRDEIATLVDEFHTMARALAAQRADLERRRDYMEALLRHATTGVVSTDPRGRVVTANPAAAALLEAAGGRIEIGEALVEAVRRVPDLAPVAALLGKSRPDAGAPEEVDVRIGGLPRRVRVVRVALPDPLGGESGTLHLVDDVTDLMRSNQLAAWAEMARAIAHEIKNPLTPIQLSTEHLERILRDRGLLPSEEIEACLSGVLSQVRALREIAAEFSAYAKIPDLALEVVEASEFLADAIAPYRAAKPPGIVVHERYDARREAAIDRKALGRAIANLVENALQAMPSGGRVVASTHDDATAGEVVLSIEDTGPGLAPEVRDRLFEPYFSTKSSGTGLGLAIVRRTVEAHGGRIEVESVPGEGTVFRVRLPFAR